MALSANILSRPCWLKSAVIERKACRPVDAFDPSRKTRCSLRYLTLHSHGDLASVLEDLPTPRGNRLHALEEDRKGQHSINDL